MKIEIQIRVCPRNREQLLRMPCVQHAGYVDGIFTATISARYTRGVTTAHCGDWLVKFSSGLWQRFGSAAHDRLVHNPDT